MLGKLIKNEFMQRYKPFLTVFAGIIGMSMFIRVIDFLDNELVIDSMYFNIFVGITATIYAIGMFGSAVGIPLMIVVDFGNRFFKSQGYLTHTLPVKTSKIIFARMVCDLATVACMALIYPLALCIATGNFDFYEELVDAVWRFVNISGSAVDKATIAANVVMVFIALFMGSLLTIWHFNVSYSIGHMFNKAKRILSVISYIVIYLIMEAGILVVGKLITTPAIRDALRFDNMDSTSGAMLAIMGGINVLMIICIAVFAWITNMICKYRLNIE